MIKGNDFVSAAGTLVSRTALNIYIMINIIMYGAFNTNRSISC